MDSVEVLVAEHLPLSILNTRSEKCAKKAAVTGMGLTLLDLKNSIDSKKNNHNNPIEKFKKSCLALEDPAKLQTLGKLHFVPEL